LTTLLTRVVGIGRNPGTPEVVVLLQVRRGAELIPGGEGFEADGLVAARIVGSGRCHALLFFERKIEKCVRFVVQRVHRGARHTVAVDRKKTDLLRRLAHRSRHRSPTRVAARDCSAKKGFDIDDGNAVHVNLLSPSL